jgi:hypothetical protein
MASKLTHLLINTKYMIWASYITLAFIFTKLLPFSALKKWIMVNLKRQVGNILSSIYTNGFIISTLTYQYKVYDIAKLYNCVINISQLFLFFHFKNRALSA